MDNLSIAMLCIHSSPLGAMGTENTGGMSTVVRETARELGALGNWVDIYTAASDGHDESVVSLADNVRLIHLDIGTHRDIPKAEIFDHLPKCYEALESFRKAEGWRYDLVHSHYWLSAIVGLRAQRDWGVPHVTTFHTLGRLKNNLGVGEDEPDLRVTWERRLCRCCHRVLVATGKEKANLIEQYDIRESKVGVVPFGVNAEAFDVQDPIAARKRIGLKADESVILFVGRFVPLKGIERLLEAVSIMDSSENIRLLLVGGDGSDADSTKRLRDLSRLSGIREKVIFAGCIEHSELVDFYNAADVLVLSSYYESFGLVALESMACGTPVVATPVGIMDSLIRNGLNGGIVSDETPEGIANSLKHVLQWVKQGKMHANHIRASVLNFSWPFVTRAILDEYVTVIDDMALSTAPFTGCREAASESGKPEG